MNSGQGSRMISGLIIKRRAYKENDIMIGAMSREEGYVELVARGARKAGSKLAGHLEPVTLSEIMIIPGKNRDYAASAINSRGFLNIKNDLSKLAYAGRAIRFLRSFIKPGEKDVKLFNVVVFALEKLENLDVKDIPAWGDFWLLDFKYQVMSALGHRPNLENICQVCNNQLSSSSFYFNISEGALVCGHCVQKAGREDNLVLTISNNCVNILKYLEVGEIQTDWRLSKSAIREGERLLEKLKDYII